MALHWCAHTPRDANEQTRTMSFPHLNSQGLHSRADPEYTELHSHAQGHLKGSFIPSPIKDIFWALTAISKCNYVTENT